MTGPVGRPKIFQEFGTAGNNGTPMSGDCLRLKTDQRGLPEDILDLTFTWTALVHDNPRIADPIWVVGASSGAFGRWVKFVYDRIDKGGPIGFVFQQYIMLTDWVGPFDPDEDLLFYVQSAGSPSQIDSMIDTAGDTDTSPLTQEEVDCSSGKQCVPCQDSPPPPGMTGATGGPLPPGTGDFGSTAGCPPHFPNCTDACKFACFDGLASGRLLPPQDVFRDYTVQNTKLWPRGGPPILPIAYEVQTVPLGPGFGIGVSTVKNGPKQAIAVTVEQVADVSGQDMCTVRMETSPGLMLPGTTIVTPDGNLVLANPLGVIKMVPHNASTDMWTW